MSYRAATLISRLPDGDRRGGVARRRRRRKADDATGWALVVVGLGVFVGVPAADAAQDWISAHQALVITIGVALLTTAVAAVWVFVRAKRRAFAIRRRVAATDGMSGPEFEQFVAKLLRASGFSKVRVCGGAGDRGQDICGFDPAGRWTIVQCKRWSKPIGSPEVQKFNGTAWTVHKAQIAMIVATSTFTRPAQVEATSHGTLLVDRAALGRWLELDQPPYPLGGRPKRGPSEVARASTDPRLRDLPRRSTGWPARPPESP